MRPLLSVWFQVLSHGVRVLAPRIIAREEPVRPVPEPAIQGDGGRVHRAHLEASRRGATFPGSPLRRLHESAADSPSAVARMNRDGVPAVYADLVEDSHGARK